LFVPKPPSPNLRFDMEMVSKYIGAAVVARATCQIGMLWAGPGLRSLISGVAEPQ
jgi:hypothetical protein